MYGKEYEEWREKRSLEQSAVEKLTPDELRALQQAWFWSLESLRERSCQQPDYNLMSDAMGPIDLGLALFR
jgi:hypothetical protein